MMENFELDEVTLFFSGLDFAGRIPKTPVIRERIGMKGAQMLLTIWHIYISLRAAVRTIVWNTYGLLVYVTSCI
jgi:hypothetical protein